MPKIINDMAEKKKPANKLVKIQALKNKGGHMKEGETYFVGEGTAKVLVDAKRAKRV